MGEGREMGRSALRYFWRRGFATAGPVLRFGAIRPIDLTGLRAYTLFRSDRPKGSENGNLQEL